MKTGKEIEESQKIGVTLERNPNFKRENFILILCFITTPKKQAQK
tara:strand:- start:444 stop:578 length:135 start_codon:yes stop_codon:yes gene_type:complete